MLNLEMGAYIMEDLFNGLKLGIIIFVIVGSGNQKLKKGIKV